MSSFEPKKLALLRILQILERDSDSNHPLTQGKIAERLEADYGIILERKAIGKNLDLLRTAGYNIRSDHRGSYLDACAFDEGQLRMLIDSVLYARHIAPDTAFGLIKKLAGLGGKSFEKTLKTSYVLDRMHDATFADFFHNIDILQQAIKEGRKVSFVVKGYGEDKQLHPVFDAPVVADPYRLVNFNGKYCLLAAYEGERAIVSLRIEYLFDVRLTKERRRHFSETDLGKTAIDEYLNAHPYMDNGRIVYARLRVSRHIFTDLIEAFGKNFTARESSDKRLAEWDVEVELHAGEWDLFRFALEHLGMAELLSPAHLRARIGRYIKDGYRDYFPGEEESDGTDKT